MTELEKLKKQIKKEASENPEKFFATDVLREKGFHRDQCSNCGMYFWSSDGERDRCGEPECSGGYTFIGDSPTEEEFSYIESWEIYREFMDKRGYEPIDRYPVIARWRDDVEFTGASIYCFQPYVVSGEAEPPADELVIPQPSLRFNDVDNVGITGRHYVLHDHLGQTCFQNPERYDQDRYFRDMFEFTSQKLGIPEKKMIFHEESWGGGGNLGPSMECFIDGLELWNQVYMFYEITPDGYEELDLQVLDMGMGHERITWISHGTETSYECVMPETLDRLKQRTGIDVNQKVWEKFLPHSSKLNTDEVENLDEKWEEIADELEMEVDELKQEIKPVAALYSIAEHSRALLFALADGKLPSNTGGGHNLRMIYRRAKDFIEKYGWDLNMREVTEWNARELSEMFPELEEKLDDVNKILEVESDKYRESRKNARERLEKLDTEPEMEKMTELYESHGVSPEMMEERGYSVPEDFYSRVASEDKKKDERGEKFDLEGIEETELLFYKDEKKRMMDAEVTAVRGEWVILDKTVFYPEGGGQDSDKGKLIGNNYSGRVEDVQKQKGVILHRVSRHGFEKGDRITGRVDWNRRKQLMQHHSGTHMVNGAVRKILGDHIWQAGAHKSVEKGRLDVTHFEKIDRDTLDRIEEEVRDMMVEDLKIEKERLKKSEAENTYGFRIYQGGAPPGSQVRVVKILNEEKDLLVDVEACGGTHLSSTSGLEEFIITGSNKVQDGVIRLNYRAGSAAKKSFKQMESRIEKISSKLGAKEPENHRKVQRKLCEIFSVEPEQLEKTVQKFIEKEQRVRIKVRKISRYLETETDIPEVKGDTVVEKSRSIFEAWKQGEKKLESLESDLGDFLRGKMENRKLKEEVPTQNMSLLIRLSRELAKNFQALVTLAGEEGVVSASYHEEYDADEILEQWSDEVSGDENFAKAFDLDKESLQ